MSKKTIYESVTGKNPKNRPSIVSKPVKDFMTFKHAQTVLGYKWPKSLENVLLNGSIRFHMVSPTSAKARMLYAPDVEAYKKIIDSQEVK